MISGVYKIYCKKTGSFYIGSSKDIESRFRAHKSDLRLGNHCNPYMQNIYNKRGLDNLVFTVLYLCPPEYRIKLEQKCIDALKPNININLLATLPPNRKGKTWSVTKEIRERYVKSNIKRGKKQREDRYARNIPYIKEYINSGVSMRKFCSSKNIARVSFISDVKRYEKEKKISLKNLHKINICQSNKKRGKNIKEKNIDSVLSFFEGYLKSELNKSDYSESIGLSRSSYFNKFNQLKRYIESKGNRLEEAVRIKKIINNDKNKKDDQWC